MVKPKLESISAPSTQQQSRKHRMTTRSAALSDATNTESVKSSNPSPTTNLKNPSKQTRKRKTTTSSASTKKKVKKTTIGKKKAPVAKSVPSSPKAPSSPKKVASSPTDKSRTLLYSSDVATIAPENEWIDLQVMPSELRPSSTLTTGQCFNWVAVQHSTDKVDAAPSSPTTKSSAWGTHNETEWIGPLGDNVLSIKETPDSTMYRILHQGSSESNDMSQILEDYFQLKIPLAPLYEEWSKSDKRLAQIAPVIPGVRILQQNPVECLFSFICSSNNNIPRITKMLSSLREKYGRHLIDIPIRDETSDTTFNLSLYSFPTLQELSKATEEDLRSMGLGYRAKYIIQTRDLLIECGGEDYLLSLRANDSVTVQEELIKFSGIGRKVADCVALFSLDQAKAIPVDVHVQHIASRDYDPSVLGSAKSLTPTIYKRVGDLFIDRFGDYAGWAHSLLFVAELPSFRDVLPANIVADMDEWRSIEMAKKAAEREEKKKLKIAKEK